MIREKNSIISDILENLKYKEELFEPKQHPLENPERILNVSEDEIKVEKFLTKEEKARQDEERKR